MYPHSLDQGECSALHGSLEVARRIRAKGLPVEAFAILAIVWGGRLEDPLVPDRARVHAVAVARALDMALPDVLNLVHDLELMGVIERDFEGWISARQVDMSTMRRTA